MRPDQVKKLRASLRFTQKQLAEELGVAPNTVARWERGDSPVSEPYSRLLSELSRRQLNTGTIRPVPGISRDEHHRKILEKLNDHLDPLQFENCAVDLLSSEYRGLAPVAGGQDHGYDGALPDTDGPPIPLVTTTSVKFTSNLQKNLEAALIRHPSLQAVLFATSRRVTPKKLQTLHSICAERNVKLINVHDQEWFAQRLYHDSSWCRSLLNLSGMPSALSVFPVNSRPVIGDKVIGRQFELQRLQEEKGDILLIGEPGSGKTFLGRALAMKGSAQFVVDWDREHLANSIREQSPDVVIVDDAQHRAQQLVELIQLRLQLDEKFRIIALSWPASQFQLKECLNITSSQVIELHRIDRNTMVEIVESLGIKHSELIRLILNQSVGRPGLAATMAHLCLQGDLRKVASGEALAELLSRFIPKSAARLLAVLSLDGTRGVPLEIPEKLLGISRQDILTALEDLEPAGVITQAGETFIVTPTDLRYVLVRDCFSGLPGMSSIVRAAIEMIPDASESTVSLIGARSRGARIPDLLDRVRTQNSERVWAAYSQLGPSESRDAIEAFERLPASVSIIAIEHIPDVVIPILLDEAKSDNRTTHNNIDHPLRIISRWCVEVSPLSVDVLARRKEAISAIAKYIRSRNEVNIGLRAFSQIFTPEFRSSQSDPGRGDRITLTRGLLSSGDILKLEEDLSFIEVLDFSANDIPWPDIFSLLRNWSTFTTVRPSDEHKVVCGRVFESLLSIFMGKSKDSPGIQLRLAEIARGSKVEIQLDHNSDFYIFYPAHGPIRHTEDDTDHLRAVRVLAEEWAATSDLKMIAEKIAAIELDATSAGLSYPRYTLTFCKILCCQIADLHTFCRILMEKGVPADVVKICVEADSDFDQDHKYDLMLRLLEYKQYEGVAISLALGMENLPNEVADDIIDRCSRWVRIVEFGCGWGDVSNSMCLRLMDSRSKNVSLYAAVGVLRPDKSLTFPPRLISKAKDVIAESRRRDLREASIEYGVGEILSADTTLAMRWIESQLFESTSGIAYSDDRLIENAFSKLSFKEKKRLITKLKSNCTSRALASQIVGGNIKLFEYLLQQDISSDVRVAPLASVDNQTWRDMVVKALEAGISERDIAGASLPDHYSWGGPESELWQSHLNRFTSFRRDEEAGVRRVVRELTSWLDVQTADALEREKKIDVYGL